MADDHTVHPTDEEVRKSGGITPHDVDPVGYSKKLAEEQARVAKQKQVGIPVSPEEHMKGLAEEQKKMAQQTPAGKPKRLSVSEDPTQAEHPKQAEKSSQEAQPTKVRNLEGEQPQRYRTRALDKE